MCQYVCERDKDGDEEGEGENDGEDRGDGKNTCGSKMKTKGGAERRDPETYINPTHRTLKFETVCGIL